MQEAFIKSPVGITIIKGDEEGIAEISVLNEDIPVPETIPVELKNAAQQLQEYFEGNRTVFDFKMNPKGTDFQKKVWKALLEIPFGTTTSYQALSIKLGDVKAIRAVAAANGKNPLWIVVPCHRVIGSDGSLTGYAGGLWRKKWLLEEIIVRCGGFITLFYLPFQVFIRLIDAEPNVTGMWIMSVFLVAFALYQYTILYIIPSKAEEHLIATYPEYNLKF